MSVVSVVPFPAVVAVVATSVVSVVAVSVVAVAVAAVAAVVVAAGCLHLAVWVCFLPSGLTSRPQIR